MLLTDPKARKPNKMTRSRMQKKKVEIWDDTVHYPDGAMLMDERLRLWLDFWGSAGFVKVMGLKGLEESKDRFLGSTFHNL